MLIKRPVFKSVNDVAIVAASLALTPYANGNDPERETIMAEYVNRLEEFKVIENDHESSVICLWGDADYFYAYVESIDPITKIENIVVVDGVNEDYGIIVKFHDDLLHLIGRSMLVGYVPIVLMKAMADYGRSHHFDYNDFKDVFDGVIEHVEDILEKFGEREVNLRVL